MSTTLETTDLSKIVLFNGNRLSDYHGAPSGDGPLSAVWDDKPHRLLYDLIQAVALSARAPDATAERDELRARLERAETALKCFVKLSEAIAAGIKFTGEPARITLKDGTVVTGELAELFERFALAVVNNGDIARAALGEPRT